MIFQINDMRYIFNDKLIGNIVAFLLSILIDFFS